VNIRAGGGGEKERGREEGRAERRAELAVFEGHRARR